jgi:hypothetical protein
VESPSHSIFFDMASISGTASNCRNNMRLTISKACQSSRNTKILAKTRKQRVGDHFTMRKELQNLKARSTALDAALKIIQNEAHFVRAAALSLEKQFQFISQNSDGDSDYASSLLSSFYVIRSPYQVQERRAWRFEGKCFHCFTTRTGIDEICKTHLHARMVRGQIPKRQEICFRCFSARTGIDALCGMHRH